MGDAPNQRFCHVACVNKDSMFVFGGYDGTSRLNDLVEFRCSGGGSSSSSGGGGGSGSGGTDSSSSTAEPRRTDDRTD